jgi:Zn ribbon nucleic-acid-binding protein
MSVTFVTVDRFASETEAHVLVMRLRDAGLHPFVANTQLQGAKGSAGFGQVYLWVQVPEEELSAAQEIAAAKLPALSDEDELSMAEQAEALARCPACHAESVDYAETNGWIVGTCAACGHRWTLE